MEIWSCKPLVLVLGGQVIVSAAKREKKIQQQKHAISICHKVSSGEIASY